MHTGRTLQQCTLHVDLGAIDQNCAEIRKHIGSSCGFCAVVKADGYGLGALRVGSRLSAHADCLAVYSPDEAGELLAAGITTPILILAPMYSIDRFHPVYRGLSVGNVHLVLHGKEHVMAISQLAKRFGFSISVHLKIDTGLHRGGCDESDASEIIEMIQLDRRLKLKGVMTHFASAVHDVNLTKLQHDRLDNILDSLQNPLPASCLIHEANTAAMIQWDWSHRNMVRVGLAWTGIVPAGVPVLSGFKSVVSWRTSLVHVRKVRGGEQVGYSGSWTAKRDSIIGVVPVGYAAGYPMQVGEEGDKQGAFVRIFDEVFSIPLGDAPVIGCVCMDQIAIDLTDLQPVGIGCGVELLSSDSTSKASLSHIAHVAGVVPHAIISRISPNVPRSYKSAIPMIVTGDGAAVQSKCV